MSDNHAHNQSLEQSLNQAINKAISLLSVREHSIHELRQKLAAFDPKIIDQMLQKLQENNYQSDGRFVESLIRSHMKRGKGSVRILIELRRHQIDQHLIQQAMAEIDEHAWQNLCFQVWEKKFSKQNQINSFKNQQKQKRFLTMRGFTTSDWQNFLK